jgi:hypothetical protein
MSEAPKLNALIPERYCTSIKASIAMASSRRLPRLFALEQVRRDGV